MMGTEDEEIERLVKKFNWEGYRREESQHQVTVPSFYMSKYPITQGQWKAVIALRTDLKVKEDLDLEPSHFKDNPENFDFPSTRSKLDLPSYGDHPTRWDRPVEQVNWYQAKEFCDRLSQLTGQEYRLPTEAEWEYACRSVTSYQLPVTSEESIQNPKSKIQNPTYPPFHFGETITSDLANYRGTEIYADEPKGEYREQTTPVGMFPPNAWGLYDMHGNVWEWCKDTWHENYKNAPTDGSAWITEDDNTAVVRGGSWFYYPTYCRSAFRDFLTRADFSFYDFGFRVVCVFGRTS
jgi:formylglycine-generating enzyme required for sulfatase activity